MEISLKQPSERIKYDFDGFDPTGLQDDINPGLRTQEQYPEGMFLLRGCTFITHKSSHLYFISHLCLVLFLLSNF